MTHITTNPPNGTPSWLDLGIPDLDRAKTFYGALFGWRFQDGGAETGHYNMCLLDGEPVAGMMRNPDENATRFWWNTYFATDDCDGTVKRAEDAGAQLVAPPMDIMDQGRMAMLKDPQGAHFGFWEGRAHPGSRIVDEPGSLVWSDLVAPDGDAARRFYTALFGYELETVPGGMDYTALRRPADGRYIGGIAGDATAPDASWVSYFQVEDADEAVRRVSEGGGAVTEEPQDTPYGRMATVRDPFGTVLRVIKAAPEPH